MKIDPDDAALVNKMLGPNEKVIGTTRQRRVGPGGSVIMPTSVVITDMRIIIVNKATLGIRHDYEAIPFSSISSVRLEQGIISSSVFIRVQGYDTDKGLLKNGKQEGEIDGLHGSDAKELADLINRKIEERAEGIDTDQQGPAPSGGTVFCSKCGAKNSSSASFCSKCGAKLSK